MLAGSNASGSRPEHVQTLTANTSDTTSFTVNLAPTLPDGLIATLDYNIGATSDDALNSCVFAGGLGRAWQRKPRGGHRSLSRARRAMIVAASCGMRWLSLAIVLAACQKDHSGSAAAEITDRSWRAHVLVVAAGERAKTCAEAGAAMQQAVAANRQAFVDAMALDGDRAKLAEATAFIEANEARYADIETRMAALSDRCAEEPAVRAAFQQMSAP